MEPRKPRKQFRTLATTRAWWGLVVLMFPTLLVSIDNTVLVFALPEISGVFSPSSAQQLWVIDSYSLALVGLLIPMGVMGDRYGSRKMLLIGASGFALVSVLAVFSPSMGFLIAARAGIGFFGATLMPSTLALIRTLFPDRDARRLAIAIWMVTFSVGGSLGPIVGGFLLEHFYWGAIFLLAIPVLVPLLVVAPLVLPERRVESTGRISHWGVVLILATMIPVAWSIKLFAVGGSGLLAIFTMLAGIGMGALFIRHQQRTARPLIELSLFRQGTFSGAILVNLIATIAIVGFLYFIPQHLQLILGLSPLVSGFWLIPGMACSALSGIAIVPLAKRYAPRAVIPVALIFVFLGYLLVVFVAYGKTAAPLGVAFVLVGIGIGAVTTVTEELILNSAPEKQLGAASAVSETAYELGSVLGTAVLGGVITAVYRGTLKIPEGIDEKAAAAARETLAGAFGVIENTPEPSASLFRDSVVSAFSSAVSITALIGVALVVLAGVIAGYTLKSTKHR